MIRMNINKDIGNSHEVIGELNKDMVTIYSTAMSVKFSLPAEQSCQVSNNVLTTLSG